jgi:enoyl-CoA hydratase/carnithine racemase
MKELRRALEEVRDREETRVIVFSGKGRGFCAGADLTGAAVLLTTSPTLSSSQPRGSHCEPGTWPAARSS